VKQQQKSYLFYVKYSKNAMLPLKGIQDLFGMEKVDA